MRQKLGVALAVVALALSGAREATEQFRQMKSLAGGWATTNAWNSLLVYAAGTFDGLAPQPRTALVASNPAARNDTKATRARRAVKSAARKPARLKAETAEPLIVELALSFDEAGSRGPDVEEFRIEVGRDAGAKGAAIVPRFAAADFETEVAREAGRARLSSEMPRLSGKDFVFRLAPVETPKSRPARRRAATRRKVEETRDEAPDTGRDGDTQEVLFEAPSDSGLLNCDEEPRR